MKMLLFFLISLVLHAVFIIPGLGTWDFDESPSVSVLKGAAAIRMTIIMPAEKKEKTEKPEENEPVIEVFEEPAVAVTDEKKAEQEREKAVPAASGMEGAVSNAAMIGRSQPPYPLMSRRRGEQGTVILLVTVSEQGTCTDVEIKSSSGFRRLDRAAADWARNASYTPGTKGGDPVRTKLKLKIPFLLRSR